MGLVKIKLFVIFSASKDISLVYFGFKKVSVPKIYKVLKKDGLAIIENFGQSKYSNILSKKNNKMLYKLAVKNLIFIQSKKIALNLPEYNL